MKKKIYDIVPPSKKQAKPMKQKVVEKNNVPKVLFGIIVVIIALFVYWFFSVSSSAVLTLWPKIFSVDFITSVLFSTTEAGELDVLNPQMETEFLEIEQEFDKEFSAASVAIEEKATGVVRMFNKQNRKITLVEGTRLLSSSDPARQFHLLKRIVIPANGQLDVAVIASEAGEDYNIEASTFSLPGLRNYSPPQLYYDVYGKSYKEMKGGRITEIQKITQQDVDRASDEIKDILEEKAKEILAQQAGEDYRILDEQIDLEIVSEGMKNAVLGQESPTFIYQAKVIASTLKVKKEDLNTFVKDYLTLNIPANKEFADKHSVIEFLPSTTNIKTDEEGEKFIDLDIAISGFIYSRIEEGAVKEVMKDRFKSKALRYIVEIYPDMARMPVLRLNPFFARKITANDENIEIRLEFE